MQMTPYAAVPATPPDLLLSRGAFEQQLIEVLPKLRAFAWNLSRNRSESDDLVQETVAKALSAYRRFEMGTDIRAWTFTILRNHRANEFRKQASRMDELTDAIALRHPVKANQEDSLALSETLDAVASLSAAHRDVLTLVRVKGYNYGQAAQLMRCPIGTIKSRLNRADTALRVAVEQRRLLAPF